MTDDAKLASDAEIDEALRRALDGLRGEGKDSFSVQDLQRRNTLLAKARPKLIDRALQRLKDLEGIRPEAMGPNGTSYWWFRD